jgi:hypothetical protein
MIDHHRICDCRDTLKKLLKPVDGQEWRDGYRLAQSQSLQPGRCLEAPGHRAGRRRQTRKPISITFDGTMRTELGPFLELALGLYRHSRDEYESVC